MDRVPVSEAEGLGVRFPEPVLSGSGDQYYDVVFARLDKTGMLGKTPREALKHARRILREKYGPGVVVLAVTGESK